MLAFLVEFAQRMLGQEGQFYPYAAGMSPTGEMTIVRVGPEHPNPSNEELVGILFSELTRQASAGMIKVAGICTDVRMVPPNQDEMTDAICVELEHRDGAAVDAFLPYEMSDTGLVTYRDLITSPGEPAIFLPSAG